MSVVPLPSPDSRAPDLDAVVALLELATAELGFDLRPRLVFVEGDVDDADTWDVGFVDVDGESVSAALLGFTAPGSWWALGTLTGGWAAPETLDDREMARGRLASRPSAHPEAVRVRSLVLMSRDGSVAGRTRMADGRQIDEPPSEGLAIDGLRRAFGLATTAPAVSVAELLTTLWLAGVDAAADEAGREGRRLTWNAVARSHPALLLLRAAGDRPKAGALVELATALGRVCTWTEVRRQVTERAWLSGVVTPELGAWMDDGMLARFLLSAFPPVEAVCDRACRRLRPDVAQQLRAAVATLAPPVR
ncbi:MAG: hypothetical protein ACRD0U_04260 [Acidimicrobiales bacterium]